MDGGVEAVEDWYGTRDKDEKVCLDNLSNRFTFPSPQMTKEQVKTLRSQMEMLQNQINQIKKLKELEKK